MRKLLPSKSLWQKRVKCELIMRDMSYQELADSVGRKVGYIRQVLSNPYYIVPPTNPTRKLINELLELEDEDELL